MPGDYYVNAVTRNFGGRGACRFVGGQDDEGQNAYAPTYYLGVGSIDEARPVTLGIGQETLDIDFNLQLLPTARIADHVMNPDDTPTTSGNVISAPDGAAAGLGRGPIGAT